MSGGGGFDLSGYVDVAERRRQFREQYPDGRLQPVDPARPFEILELGGATFVVYVAAAYRSPDDTRPGIGAAWEPFPGRTPYTRDSELQNAETSAWGRAIFASLALDEARVASADEVRARQADQSVPAPRARRMSERAEQLLARAKALDEAGFDVAGARADADLPTIRRATKVQLDAWSALLDELDPSGEVNQSTPAELFESGGPAGTSERGGSS